MARWKGQALHTTTGDARVNASHIHSSNCRAGTIDSASTGIASAAVTRSRWRAWSTGSVWSWPISCVAVAASSGDRRAGQGGAVSEALDRVDEPLRSTVPAA